MENGTCGNRFDNWLPEYNSKVDHKYVFSNLGYNLKPLDLQGAIGLAQLEKVDKIHERRNSEKTIANIINRYLDVFVPDELEYSETSWFGTPIVCNNKEEKDKLVKHFEDNRIQTRNYFAGNILIHPAYYNLGDWKEFPKSNQVLDRVFFIGAAPHYNKQVFNYIEDVLKKF